MDIETAKTVLTRTHVAALAQGVRASGYHLESSPGLGKTDGTAQSCAALAREIDKPVGLVVFMLATISSADVRGFMMPTKGDKPGTMGTVFSTPPWMPTPENTTVFHPDGSVSPKGTYTSDVPDVGVLLLDEFSQAEDDVKKPAAELVYKGEVGTAVLPVGWRVVSAGNRLSDRSGVLRELMFIVNRRARITIDPNLPVWLNYQNGLPSAVRAHYLTLSFAQKNPDVVFADKIPDGSDPFCTPRTLCLMDRDLQALRSGEDIAKSRLPTDSVAREVAAGWIGGGSAAQFFTHLKYNDELPEIGDIERDPAKAKLPPNKDAQMVCGYMLAHHTTQKNVDRVMDYVGRLTIEMQVLSMRALLAQQSRAADVISTRGVTAWLAKNKALLAASRA